MRRTLKAKHHNNQSGFTLIEMAIVILILGVGIAAFVPLYNVHLKKERVEATQKHVEMATEAIGHFRSLYGRYPCPASLTDDRDDSSYGREDCDPIILSGDRGLYLEKGIRDPFEYQTPSGVIHTEKPIVRIGFLPFRHLNMDEEDAYDGYEHRILYAVTEHLTCAECFDDFDGGIEILNERGETAIGDPSRAGTAHFIVISHGANGYGAFTQSGERLDCAETGPERENCDYDDQPEEMTEMAIYNDMRRGTSGDLDDEFDDTVSYFVQDSVPLWQLSETTGDLGNIHTKTTGPVAVVTSDGGDIIEESNVNGTLLVMDNTKTPSATEGKMVAKTICDENGANCFNPKIFAGEIDIRDGHSFHAGLTCPADDPDGTGAYMVGIRNGTAICEDEVIVRCPPGAYLLGINPDGSTRCNGSFSDEPDGCATEGVDICGAEGVLLASSHGSTYTLEGGYNRVETYICNDGEWLASTASGSCTCTGPACDDGG